MRLADLIFLAMAWLLPPAKGAASATYPPQAVETVAERESRYHEIAEALAAAVAQEDPIPHTPPLLTAAVALGLTFEETRWHRHVDLGTDPATSGQRTGQWCMGQINIGRGTTPQGWTGPELVADRVKCFRAVIHAARRSWWACPKNPDAARLAVYASGQCTRGHDASAVRMRTSYALLYQMIWASRHDPAPVP